MRRVRDERDRRRVTVEVDERAVTLGRSHFGPLIGQVVELLRSYDERELEAIGSFRPACGRRRQGTGGSRDGISERRATPTPGNTGFT